MAPTPGGCSRPGSSAARARSARLGCPASIETSSTPAIPARSAIASMPSAAVKTVWCEPPAVSQPSAAVVKSGRGFHRALATGSFGSASGGAITSTSFATSRKRSPRSTRLTTTAGPGEAVKTSLTGSSCPPIASGWISQDGRPAAIDGQISSMCAPRTFAAPGGQVVGVVLHERRSARQPDRHHLQDADECRGLPVALARRSRSRRPSAAARQCPATGAARADPRTCR